MNEYKRHIRFTNKQAFISIDYVYKIYLLNT